MFFSVDAEQQVYVIASPLDGVYINMKSRDMGYVDLDELYNISQIKNIIYDIEE